MKTCTVMQRLVTRLLQQHGVDLGYPEAYLKLAVSSFRGETLEGVLGEVASSDAFMDELVRRSVDAMRADVTGYLEALFARFCRQEQELDEFRTRR